MGSVIEDDLTPVDGALSRIEPFPTAPTEHRRSIVALVVLVVSLLLVAGALVVGRF